MAGPTQRARRDEQRHRWRHWLAGLVLALAPLAHAAPVSAASFPVFDPRSARAGEIVTLTWIVLGFVALVFVLTETALIYAIIRYRQRGEAGEPRQIVGNRALEIVWTAIPALILLLVFVLTVRAMVNIHAAPVQAGTLTVVVTGHQWWWEYRYPDLGIVTANELHIPAGQTVRLRLVSADVIHSFWAPQLGRKMDLVPGKTNELYLAADQPGTYDGACAEFCGAQHAWMRLRVIADLPDRFAAWVEQQRQPAAAPSGVAEQGRQLFLQGSGNCAACHTIAGTGAAGQVGPDLTHVGSRQTLGAGVLPNTPEAMARWLRNPQAVKPDSLMPNPRLTEDEVRALTAYLDGLR
jgi:cytochrome c oxidase subunit 2